MRIRVGNKHIGDGEPVFTIAEIGINHNGDLDLAKKMIEAAAWASADAVKFQTFVSEEVTTSKPEVETLKKFELKPEHFKEIHRFAMMRNMMFLSTPFDERSVDLLEEIGIPAFKVSSGDITHQRLLKYIAEKGKPVILSTGMSWLGEIEQAIEVVVSAGCTDIILLHCVSEYPARLEDMNLNAIKTLKAAFNFIVGLSDHTPGIEVAIAATALGAKVIEKHFTMSKDLPGPDQKASLEPEEFKSMVLAIRNVEKALGDGTKKPREDEERIKRVGRRSLVATVDIPKGSVITRNMLDIKRPGTGIEPKYLDMVMGRKVKRNITEGEVISWSTIK